MDVKLFAMGGVRSLLTHCKSSEFFKIFAKRIYSRARKNRYKKINSKGTVLIEFAICIPILIILLFYVNDLIRIRRLYSQTEFVGQQIVNMIQNISQKRSDKKLKREDISNIFALACQTIYPGTTMFVQEKGFEFAHTPLFKLYYVQGLNGNKASCKWRIGADSYALTYNNPDLLNNCYTYASTDSAGSSVRYKTEVIPSEIYPTLKIDSGVNKIILEIAILRDSSNKNYGKGSITDKQAFSLHLVNPKKRTWDRYLYFFTSVIIFTPKPGLFDETPPQ